jgi:hypothetical protein
MADGSHGFLPKSSSNWHYDRGYADGDYFIRKTDPAWDRMPDVQIDSSYSDAIMQIDARFVGESKGRYVAMYCRDQGMSPSSQYRLSIRTDTGSFLISRLDAGRFVTLADWQRSEAIHVGNDGNHLLLSCVGRTITAISNGVQLASINDSTYQVGHFGFAAGVFSDSLPATSDARFRNLLITYHWP